MKNSLYFTRYISLNDKLSKIRIEKLSLMTHIYINIWITKTTTTFRSIEHRMTGENLMVWPVNQIPRWPRKSGGPQRWKPTKACQGPDVPFIRLKRFRVAELVYLRLHLRCRTCSWHSQIPLDLRSISGLSCSITTRLTCPFPPTWNTQTRKRGLLLSDLGYRGCLRKGIACRIARHSVEKLINLASRFKHGRVPFWKGKRDISRLGSMCVLRFFGFAFDCNHVYEEHFFVWRRNSF